MKRPDYYAAKLFHNNSSTKIVNIVINGTHIVQEKYINSFANFAIIHIKPTGGK